MVLAVHGGQLRHVALAPAVFRPSARASCRTQRQSRQSLGCRSARGGTDWRRNEGIELTFLETGSLGFGVENQEFHLKAGDLTVTRPWQQHAQVGDPQVGAGRLHFLILDVGVRRPHQIWRWPKWIVLHRGDLRQLTDILRHNQQPVWRASSEVARSFGRIASAVEDHCADATVGWANRAAAGMRTSQA